MVKYILKIPFVGDGGVGKTSFTYQYVQKKFTMDYRMTIGVDFQLKHLILPDGNTVTLQLWDTGGQERFTSIRTLYYKNSHGFVFLFDVTRMETFKNLKFWIKEIYKHNPEAKIIIIGNKIDLIDERIVSSIEARNYALSERALFAETSAKTGEGINNAMLSLIQIIISELQTQSPSSVKDREDISKLKRTVHPQLLNDDEILLYELKTKDS